MASSSNTPRMDAELGIVWPVTITVAGLPPEEIGVVPGGNGPERAMDDLVLLLHEWADFIAANKAGAIASAAAIAASVPAAFRRPAADPAFEVIEAEAVRAAAAAYRRAHGEG
jgi:hypothetical protein